MNALAQRVARRFQAAFFNVGDIILYGKYKNKKGRIVSFGKNDKGQPTVEIEPIPKGRKKNKVMGLFKIWNVSKKEEAVAKQQEEEEKAKKTAASKVRWSKPEALTAFETVIRSADGTFEIRRSTMGRVPFAELRIKKLSEVPRGTRSVQKFPNVREAKRIAELLLVKKQDEKTAAQVVKRFAGREQIGEVAVDSGQLMVLDPAYTSYLDGQEHPEFNQDSFRGNTEQIHFDNGAPAAMNLRGWGGDGIFPVYQTTDDKGLVTKVEIVFNETASRVATRFRRATLDPKMQAVLESVRKKATGPLTSSVAKLKAILDTLGGWSVEPIVGLVALHAPTGHHYPSGFIGDRKSVEEVHAIAKAHEVTSLPTTPKADAIYTMAVTDVEDHRDEFEVEFKLWMGAWGWKITSPDRKELELLPHYSRIERFQGWRNSNFSDLRSIKKLGKRVNKLIQLYDVPRWLFQETRFLDQVNEALGMEPHEPSKLRTRENTGSCPCCFRNIKLKAKSGAEHPVVVNHGFQRPGWGYIVGNCIGVGFPPFELSPEGTLHLRDKVLKPHLEDTEKALDQLKAGKVTKIVVQRGSWGGGEEVTPESPLWERTVRDSISKKEQDIRSLSKDIKTLDGLLSGWKPLPLPEPGHEVQVWK